MFDVGWQEGLVIVIAALVLVGPEKLPETLRWFASILKKANLIYTEVMREIMSIDLPDNGNTIVSSPKAPNKSIATEEKK